MQAPTIGCAPPTHRRYERQTPPSWPHPCRQPGSLAHPPRCRGVSQNKCASANGSLRIGSEGTFRVSLGLARGGLEPSRIAGRDVDVRKRSPVSKAGRGRTSAQGTSTEVRGGPWFRRRVRLGRALLRWEAARRGVRGALESHGSRWARRCRRRSPVVLLRSRRAHRPRIHVEGGSPSRDDRSTVVGVLRRGWCAGAG